MARKRSRSFLTVAAAALVAATMAFAFWPRPVMVDIGAVARSPMTLTIDEEGRTRVRNAYVVSTPVAGRLLRVHVEPGDPVERGVSVIAQMLPTNPSALDVRSREQARAAVAAAEAAMRVARADLNRATADKELAAADLERAKRLRTSNTVSEATLDRALREARSADASLDMAEAAIGVRQAELENARAQLISFDDQGLATAIGAGSGAEIPLRSPATGRVLRLIQESETTLPAGAPIMEIGNIEDDLEVLVELLSTDAVKVSVGDRAIIDDWGGPETLNAVVERIDPWGFTKFSALGVEEQRVNAIIRFTDPAPSQQGLGHGFRVEARIVVWENPDALAAPSSALFRDGADWAVFRVEDGAATLRRVEIGRNNGVLAEVLGGLEAGDRVVLYPSSGLADGVKVSQREIR